MSFELNLKTETVEAVGPLPPRIVAPSVTVRAAMEQMRDLREGSVLICRDEVLVGIFTERDALGLMAREADLDVPLEEVMTVDPVSIHASATVGEAIRSMSSGGYRRLPIVDDEGRPVGTVKTSGILNYLVEHVPEAVYNLPPTPRPVTQEREGA
ncbi:MAG: CBS domain-containing protein [Planctomycetes bacterium]|nr:CBS domain-containing protein [Planctomycetota bacterium]